MLIGKKVLAGCWVCALALALSACGGGESESSSEAPATAAAVAGSSGNSANSGASTSSTTTSSTSASSSSASSISSIANQAPVISGLPMITATVGAAYSFTPTATDPDGDALTFSASNVPSWATFSAATRTLSGTPSAPGTFANIVISVSDGVNTISLPAFSIEVTAPVAGNRAPLISGSPVQSIAPGTAYSFTPSGADPDGDVLTWSVSGLPAWLSFNASTRTISGTPTAANRGTTGVISISVSDGKGGIGALAGFTITVINRAPTISGTPATSVAAGAAYSFTPTSADADGDTRTFAIANKPGWATFNTATGALTGTPGSVDKGTFAGVSISVSDGKGGSASLTSFTITVMNTAPTITGTPVTSATVGSAYSFIPTGADANGDTLTYSYTGTLPTGLTMNTSTGRISGTPTVGGTYANIVVRVTDTSGAAASLPAFTIVVASTSGSAVLTWTVPTQNTDGSALSDLTGYKIYYGTSPSNLSGSVSISGGATTTATINGLTTGATYYFAIASISSSGGEGNKSNTASKAL